MISLSEIETQFKNTMLDAGVITEEAITGDGKLHRVYGVGDKRGTKNIAYVLHCDGNPSGWFMHYKTGVSAKWTLSGKREPLPDSMLEQISYARKIRQAEQEKANQHAAEKARWIWEKAKPITEERQHPYLINKRVKPHCSRGYREALVIPLVNELGAIVNLQFIAPNGEKRFLSGGRKKGCYCLIGENKDTLLIAEGFATAASLHESTGKTAVIAFDAGNLAPVAETIRRQFPDARIIIAADNDDSGIGQTKAHDAALVCGGKYLIPPMAGDFNDFVNAGGVLHG
jgi:putative DNA primase/helicase